MSDDIQDAELTARGHALCQCGWAWIPFSCDSIDEFDGEGTRTNHSRTACVKMTDEQYSIADIFRCRRNPTGDAKHYYSQREVVPQSRDGDFIYIWICGWCGIKKATPTDNPPEQIEIPATLLP